nr:hypothetical protein 12 [bacterium]
MATATAPTIGRFHGTTAREVMDHHRKHPRRCVLTINTHFIPPTDTDGSKYGAIDEVSNLFTFVHASYELTTAENHLAAAIGLIREHFYGKYILTSYEGNRADNGYLFTFEAAEV